MKNSILEKARWLRDVALATSKNNGARVAREWLKYAAMFVMLFTIGSGNAWGTDLCNFTTFKGWPQSNYADNKTYTPSTGVTWGFTGIYRNSTTQVFHQIKKSTSNCVITTPTFASNIGTITVTFSAGTGTVTIKNSEGTSFGSAAYTSSKAAVIDISSSKVKQVKICVSENGTATAKMTALQITAAGGGDCSECTYYVYDGSDWVDIGTTGFDDVVLAPPTLPSNYHGAGNGCWVTDKNIYDGGGCVTYTSGDKYRYVPNPNGAAPDADNKPGSGTCELYAVYKDNGCLSTKVTAIQCARIWEEPEPNTPSVSGSNVTLSWSAVTGASGYHLYVTDYDSYELDVIVDGTSKTITGLADGTYSWTVAANSPTDGDACDSNASDGKDFEIVGCTDISSSTVTGVSVTPSKVGGSATWTAVANATSYEVKVYAGTATSGSALFSAEPTSNSCAITGLSAGTQYTVVVKAKNSCSTSNQGKATWTTSALTLYTVTWSVNGSTYTTTENVAYNTTTLTPANPDVPGECTGSTFMGWTENSSWASDSAPGDLFNGTTPTITGNKTFYAVFADEN